MECRFEESSSTDMTCQSSKLKLQPTIVFQRVYFNRQRIHFKRQLYNNQVVLIAQRITLPSALSQSQCTEITYYDPRRLIAVH